MDFRERAEITARAVCEVLRAKASAKAHRQITEIIEGAMLDAVLEDGERYMKLVTRHCAADRDLAHKITEGIRQAQTALVTNLSSMR